MLTVEESIKLLVLLLGVLFRPLCLAEQPAAYVHTKTSLSTHCSPSVELLEWMVRGEFND